MLFTRSQRCKPSTRFGRAIPKTKSFLLHANSVSLSSKNLGLVARVELLAREKSCTPSQLALAWLLAQGSDILLIPGTKRRKYLEENLGALQVQLTHRDLRRIDEVAPKGVASGLRYPEAMMNLVNG